MIRRSVGVLSWARSQTIESLLWYRRWRALSACRGELAHQLYAVRIIRDGKLDTVRQLDPFRSDVFQASSAVPRVKNGSCTEERAADEGVLT